MSIKSLQRRRKARRFRDISPPQSHMRAPLALVFCERLYYIHLYSPFLVEANDNKKNNNVTRTLN